MCRGVFSKYNDYQISERDRFYSKNRDLSKSDHQVNHVTNKGDY